MSTDYLTYYFRDFFGKKIMVINFGWIRGFIMNCENIFLDTRSKKRWICGFFFNDSSLKIVVTPSNDDRKSIRNCIVTLWMIYKSWSIFPRLCLKKETNLWHKTADKSFFKKKWGKKRVEFAACNFYVVHLLLTCFQFKTDYLFTLIAEYWVFS